MLQDTERIWNIPRKHKWMNKNTFGLGLWQAAEAYQGCVVKILTRHSSDGLYGAQQKLFSVLFFGC